MVGYVLTWGFAATTVLTTILAGCRGLGFTRIDIPFMLGTLLTPDRDRAKWFGTLLHFFNGWMFSIIYAAAFAQSGVATWWFGAMIGFVHALFVATVGMNFLPGLHPRMASETRGPEPTQQLEPPGFLALNYGAGTPIVTIIAHMIYGGILGAFFR
jgi:hypothetical protein